MRRLFLLLFLPLFLLANCYPIESMRDKIGVLDDGKPHCATIDQQNICIERDIIKLKKEGSNAYEAICLNGERLASGYPYLKGEITKVGRWYSIDGIYASAKGVSFWYKGQFFQYDFNTTAFRVLDLPKKIMQIKELYGNKLAIEYIKDKKLRLGILDKESYIFKVLKSYGMHTHLRRSNVIDFIESSSSDFADYLKDKLKSKSDNLGELFAVKSGFESNLKAYQPPIGAKFQKIEQKDIEDAILPLSNITPQKRRDGKELLITSLLFNEHLQPLSRKHFSMTKEEYSKLLNERFESLQKELVWGYKSYLIVLFTLFSIGLVVVWVRRLVGTLSLPTISSFFLFWYILIPVIGSTYMNLFYTEYEYNLGFYERKDLIFTTWLYTIIGLYLIPFGMQIANWLFKYDAKKSFQAFLEQPISYLYERALFVVIVISMAVSLAVLYIYIQKIGVLPIIGVFENLSPTKLAELRSQAGNDFNGKLYRYIFFIKTLPLLWLIVAYFYKFVSKKWFITFILLLIYNIFVSIMDLEKAPLVNLLMILLIVHFYIVGRINWRYVLWFIFIALGSLVVMYIYFMGISSRGVLDTLVAPFHRAFIGSISPFFWWQLYSEQYGLLHGLTLPNPHHIFDFENHPISKEVMAFVHPELKDLGIVGSMPTVFWADWYINFGIFVAFLGMILFGFILQSLDIFLINRMKKRKRVLMVALFVYLLFYFKRYSSTSYLGMLFDTNLVLPILLLLVLNEILKRKFARDDKHSFNRFE